MAAAASWDQGFKAGPSSAAGSTVILVGALLSLIEPNG